MPWHQSWWHCTSFQRAAWSTDLDLLFPALLTPTWWHRKCLRYVFLSMCTISKDTKACKGPTGLRFHGSDGKLTRFNELFPCSVDSSCNTKCWQVPNCVFQNKFQLCKCITSSQVTWVSSCLFCRTLITVMKAPHLESSGWQCFCRAHHRSPDTFTFC